MARFPATLVTFVTLSSVLLHAACAQIAPKVFILSMFQPESDAWSSISEFNVSAKTIPVPGFPPEFPNARCTADDTICQLTTGEGEISAAVTVSSLVRSRIFDLSNTYFLIAGIAGASPKVTTTGSVTLARFAVQVALQYEIDGREIPVNFTSGYMPLGAKKPGVYPTNIYGTEVFELNDNLRQIAADFAKKANLSDTAAAQAYRSHYAGSDVFSAATQTPSVVLCDTATSDNYWIGTLLAEEFENTTSLFTNSKAKYCTTQQEDNATLEALLRGAVSGLVDFSRIIIMRTVADFDRPYPGQTAYEGLTASQSGGTPALANIYRAGVQIVQGIVAHWDARFEAGIKADNYVGDIAGSLGVKPPFVPESALATRKLSARSLRMVRRFGSD